MERKADRKIIEKLAAGLRTQAEVEASTLAMMRAKHPESGWFFVSRLDALGQPCRILCSVPPSDNEG